MLKQKNFSEESLVRAFKNGNNTIRAVGFKANLLSQIETSGGIPDLVGIRISHIKILTKFSKSFPTLLLTNGYAKVLSVLSRKTYLSRENILKKTGLSVTHFRKIISVMEGLKIIEKNQRGDYKFSKLFNIPKIELRSFEFKLHDWRSALRQSLRYRAFSTRVTVVMPISKKNVLERNKKSFRRFRIGAAVFDKSTNQFYFVVKPLRCGVISKKAYIDVLGRLKSNLYS
ncbi:MAG: hypothetical protein Q8N59_03435 [bacterium]|nr:hypothetical protein [bacterium]